MQLRCTYCQTPFALRLEEALIALQAMQSEGLNHYDAHCPRCRRANQIPRERMERAYPGWQAALKDLEKEAARQEKESKAAPAAPKPETQAPAAGAAKPAPKKPAAARPAEAGKKPTAEKKPAPKTTPKTGQAAKPGGEGQKKPAAGRKPATGSTKK